MDNQIHPSIIYLIGLVVLHQPSHYCAGQWINHHFKNESAK